MDITQYINSPAFGIEKGGNLFLKREKLNLSKYKQLERAKILHYALITLALIFALTVGIFIIYWISKEDKDIYGIGEKIIMWLILGFCIIIGLVAIITLLFSALYEKKVEAAIKLNRSMSNLISDRYINPELHNSMGTILGNNAKESEQITNFFNQKIPANELPKNDITQNYKTDRNNLINKITNLQNKLNKNSYFNKDMEYVNKQNGRFENQINSLTGELNSLEENYGIVENELRNSINNNNKRRQLQLDRYYNSKASIKYNNPLFGTESGETSRTEPGDGETSAPEPEPEPEPAPEPAPESESDKRARLDSEYKNLKTRIERDNFIKKHNYTPEF